MMHAKHQTRPKHEQCSFRIDSAQLWREIIAQREQLESHSRPEGLK